MDRQTAASLADTDHTRCEPPQPLQPEPHDKQVENLMTAASSSDRVSSLQTDQPTSPEQRQPELLLVHHTHTVHDGPPDVVDIVT